MQRPFYTDSSGADIVPVSGASATSAGLDWVFKATGDMDSYFKCRVDSDPFVFCKSGQPFPGGPFSSGTHTAEVMSFNGVTESASTFSRTFVVP